MNKLELFLDKHDNQELANDIFNRFEDFDYEDILTYNHHLRFLLENCYNIKITNQQKVRLNQKQFREQLIKKFNGKCIISHNDCLDELDASHIIPVADNESYDIDNGLLLTSTLHVTMDKLLWAINPETLLIEVKPNCNVGQIKNFVGQKVNIQLNEELKKNLSFHYTKFIKQ